jgi:hypothetical protein
MNPACVKGLIDPGEMLLFIFSASVAFSSAFAGLLRRVMTTRRLLRVTP